MKFYITLLICCLSLNAWSLRVLQIGNSHTVGSFGDELYRLIRNSSAVSTSRSIGLAGSSGSHWSSDSIKSRTLNYGYIDRPSMTNSTTAAKSVEKLSTLINTEKPDVLIVELGDNFAGYRDGTTTDTEAKKQIQRILNQITTANKKVEECFWVGPNWTEKDGTNQYKKTNERAKVVAEIIKKEIKGKCTFIDSMQIMTKAETITGHDGLHFDKKSGKLWGQRAYEAITLKSDLLKPINEIKPAGIEQRGRSQN